MMRLLRSHKEHQKVYANIFGNLFQVCKCHITSYHAFHAKLNLYNNESHSRIRLVNMKRTLIFISERLQIEGKLQVKLISAFCIFTHLRGKENQVQQKMGGCPDSRGHLYGCKSHKKWKQ
jgi:hypothetical protein